MADNKLSWTELRKALALRAGTNEKEAKLFLEGLSEKGAAAIILLIVLTMVVWPTAFFEDCAVYSDMCDYCHDVANHKESSAS